MTIDNISDALIAKKIYIYHIVSGLPKREPYNSMYSIFASSNFIALKKYNFLFLFNKYFLRFLVFEWNTSLFNN